MPTTNGYLELIKAPLRKAVKHLFPEIMARRWRQETASACLPTGEQVSALLVALGSAPCNHNCIFCYQSIEKPKTATWLDVNLLRHVVQQFPATPVNVHMSANTETFFAPNLVDSVRMIKEERPDCPIILSTNGSRFRPHIMEELIDLKLNTLSYSFDGATREDYKLVVGNDSFDLVWENLEKIVQMRDRKGSNMEIHTHIMGFKGMEASFERFRKQWEGKNVYVHFRRVCNWGGSERGMAVEKQLAEAGLFPHQPTDNRYPCGSLFAQIKLGHTGDYWLCSSAISDYDDHGVPNLGHASEVPLQEVWQKMSQYRCAHLRGEWDSMPYCVHCTTWSMWYDYWERDPNAEETFFLDSTPYAR